MPTGSTQHASKKGRTPRRRGRGNAGANEGRDDTERDDQASGWHATVDACPGCGVKAAEGGFGAVDACSVCDNGSVR